MTPTDLINEFLKYSVTPDFRNNVYANMAAMVLEVCLLLVLLPLLIWAFKWSKRRRARAMAGFYTLQFLREAVLMLLRAGGMTDIKGCIENELKIVGSYENHITYGNTPFLLELLRRRMNGGQHVEGHLKLSGEEIAALQAKSQALLGMADQYAFLFASIEQSEYNEKFYEVRFILYAMRDYFEDLTPLADKAFFPTDDIRGMTTVCAQFVDRWFSIEKKRMDHAISREHNLQFAIFIVRGLHVFGHRVALRPYCRIGKKPYIDPMACNVFPRLLSAVLDLVELTSLQLRTHLNLTASEILSYSMDYQRPPYGDQVAILLKASALIPESIWAGLVVSKVMSDLDGRRPGLIEIDSAKAGAIAWLSTLLSPERLQDPAISDLRMKLFFMKPRW